MRWSSSAANISPAFETAQTVWIPRRAGAAVAPQWGYTDPHVPVVAWGSPEGPDFVNVKYIQDRFRLKRYFSIAAGLLLLAVALPLVAAYYYSEVREHTTLAGTRNEMLARVYANLLWPTYGTFLLDSSVSLESRRNHPTTVQLDAAFRQMSHEAPVIKMKVYNLDGVAVYSSVLKEIGENKSANSGYQSARGGKLFNELTHRGSMSATEGQIENVDVVSSYIPIQFDASGKVTAVFELYSNVTETVGRIETVTMRLLFVLLAVFLLLYLALLAIVGRADQIIVRQYERILESEEKAEAANRAKSDFLSGMSHELRTPMNAILGFAQLLQSEPKAPLAPSQQRFVHQIIKAGEHLMGLINQVLDLSRIEAGKMQLSIEPVPLQAVCDESLPLVQHLAGSMELQPIETDVGDVQVMADYGRLKQVLLNLMSNAIKYNRRGGAVKVQAVAHDGEVQIRVSDTGEGIAAERQQELFQPFSRLGIDSSEIEGTGIGLVLSKHIVEAMGGRIGVESTPGQGSTFWIRLPLALPASQLQTPDAAASPDSATPAGDRVAPVRERLVLYIEDNPANVLLMEEIVGRLGGIRLQTAHTAEIGLGLAQLERPAVIIMDINLPGMSGLQALQQLRSDPQLADIPVLALTANALEGDISRGLAAGFNGYYTKPVQIDVFSAALTEMLERRRNGV